MNSTYDIFWKKFLSEKGLVGRNKNDFFSDFYEDVVLAVDPELVLEIGAFEAGFSRSLRNKNITAEILAFEANPHVYKQYVDKIPEDIEYVNNLVSSDHRERRLYIPRRIETPKSGRDLGLVNRMSSMLVHDQSTENDEIVFDTPETIDSLIKVKNKTNVALWIDVEGAAGEVLFGAKNSLASGVISTVYVELENKASWGGQWVSSDVRKFLGSYGLEPLCRDNEAVNQFNEIYVHSSFLENVTDCYEQYICTLVSAA